MEPKVVGVRCGLAAMVMACAGGIASAQWQGPFTPSARVEYTGGNVYIGPQGAWNERIRFGVNEPGFGTQDIALYGFAGTPPSQVRTTAIWGETNNPNGRGLQGFNFATSGNAEGIWAETASVIGTGLRARATATTGANFAGYLDTASSSGTGLYATATSTTGSTIGVWGNTVSTSGYAGYFTGGNVFIQRNLSIGTPLLVSPLTIGGTGGATPRAWMTNGIFVSPSNESDGAYFGTKTESADRVDAVVAWGDNVEDNLRFIASMSGGPANGTELMRIAGSGNVGIGTNNPRIRLDVGGFNTIGTTTSVITNNIHDVSNRGNKVQFGYVEPTSTEFVGMRTLVQQGSNGCGNTADVAFHTWECQTAISREVMRINGRGNVGIGTASPSSSNRLQVNGNISGTTIDTALKNFKIDHPLDPENKYLYHASIESNEVVNIYSGNVTTDGAGFATITMPSWFEALNEDCRYQLTIIDDGGTWAQARIAREMDLGSFVIQTNVPQIKVSWQVTGKRRDAFIKAHPMQVEMDKAAGDRGKLLHPDAFGEPASRGIGYTAPEPAMPAPAAAPAVRSQPTVPAVPVVPPRVAPKSNEPPLVPANRSAGRQ